MKILVLTSFIAKNEERLEIESVQHRVNIHLYSMMLSCIKTTEIDVSH